MGNPRRPTRSNHQIKTMIERIIQPAIQVPYATYVGGSSHEEVARNNSVKGRRGYMTNKDRFVSPRLAGIIAVKARQVLRSALVEGQLISDSLKHEN